MKGTDECYGREKRKIKGDEQNAARKRVGFREMAVVERERERNSALYVPMELCLYFNEGAMLILLAACSSFPSRRRRRRAHFSILRLPQTTHGIEARLKCRAPPHRSKLTNKFALHLCICKFSRAPVSPTTLDCFNIVSSHAWGVTQCGKHRVIAV